MAPTVTLPVAGAAPAAANTAAPAATEASQDFMSMLGQLLGTSVPTPAVATPVAPFALTTNADKDSTELPDSAALEAMLPFSLATPMNGVALVPAAGGASDGVDISALMPAAVCGPDRSLMEAVLGALPQSTNQEQGDAAMFANLNGSTALPVDEAAKARAATSSDIGRGLHTPVGSSEWADELGTRMTWMAEHGHQTASLRLSPEHLGPLEIRISIREDQASVWFGAAHADTRAAIEQALPRLRELFGAQGLSLADAGVSHEAPHDRSRPHVPGSHGDAASGREADANVITIAHRRLGLVDAYA
jgi:hypothetical protein